MLMCEMLLLARGVARTRLVLTAWMALHTAAAALGAKGVFSVLAAGRKCH